MQRHPTVAARPRSGGAQPLCQQACYEGAARMIDPGSRGPPDARDAVTVG